MSIRSMLIPAMLLVATTAPAAFKMHAVGDWTVAQSKDGQGCFLTRTYDHPGETTLMLGLDTDGSNHLSVLNANWSIRAQDRLKLDYRLWRGSYPKHLAIGIVADGKQGFVAAFEAKFPAYFATSRLLSITKGDVPVERLDIDGSGPAVDELRRCVAGLAAPTKPAAGKPKGADIPLDPFAHEPARKARG